MAPEFFKYVITALIDPESHQRLCAWRNRYFPPERNFLEAHITLFHAVPLDKIESWETSLIKIIEGYTSFPVTFTEPFSLGRGVAIRARAEPLIRLRRVLAGEWSNFLTPQDAHGFRAHCTLQNKVSREESEQTLAEIKQGWRDWEGQVQGVSIWRYRGGPWEPVSHFHLKG